MHPLRTPGEGWRCTSPAFTHRRTCSHLDAVRLVAAEPGYCRLGPRNTDTDQQTVLEVDA